MKLNQPQILLVDDDMDIRESLSLYLERQHLRVVSCASAEAARGAMAAQSFDLLLLDIMMPHEDGLSFFKSLDPETRPPVILLTAMNSDANKVRGLDLGADDYVDKPFNPRVLLARIMATLRRAAPLRAAIETAARRRLFSGMEHDPDARSLRLADGTRVALTAGENKLLHLLLTRPGEVISRDEITRLIGRPSTGKRDRSADNCVLRLRRKLGEDARAPRLLVTDWGGGYRMMTTVTEQG